LLKAVRHDVDRALVDEANDERATLHDVAVPERLLLRARVVEVRTVRAAEILDDEATILVAKLRVAPRHHSVVGADRALQASTDEDGIRERQLDRSLPALAVPENQACH
jgi:hypothetical protein